MIRDTSALRSAVSEMVQGGANVSLVEHAKPRMYYGDQHGICDFVLQLPGGKYDVGFDRQADGTYAPVFDEWGGHVANEIGASCPMPSTPEGRAQHQIGQFMQLYAKHAAINAASAQGYVVEDTVTDEAGNIHLVMGGM